MPTTLFIVSSPQDGFGDRRNLLLSVLSFSRRHVLKAEDNSHALDLRSANVSVVLEGADQGGKGQPSRFLPDAL
jgi:hypothetical protein